MNASFVQSTLRVLIFTLAIGSQLPRASAGNVATFDDLPLASESYFGGPVSGGQVVNGPYGPVTTGTFTSGGVQFVNNFDNTYESWSGFAYSNTTDKDTPGWTNQFSAYTGKGYLSSNYGVAFGYDNSLPNIPTGGMTKASLDGLPEFTLPTGGSIQRMYITNTTYAVLSMLTGDSFAKKFGGVTGNDTDWFKLTAYGVDAAGNVLANSVDFYLADYRFSDNSKDYIVTDWTYWDLSKLAGASTLYFNLSSSDSGRYGMNTPGYFAVDNISYSTAAAVPEPSSLVLSCAGAGILCLTVRIRQARANSARNDC